MSAGIDGNMDSGVNNSIDAGTASSNTPNVDAALEKEATSTENSKSILGQSPPEARSDSDGTNPDDNGSILGKKPDDEDEGGQEEQEEAEESQDLEKQPIAYKEFTMPENVRADKKTLEEATAQFKELGLSQEQAQGIIDYSPEFAKTIQAANQHEWDTQTAKWMSEVENDPEIGGANYKDTEARVNRVVTRFDKDGEFLKFFGGNKAGNHPAMVRFLLEIDKATSEGGFEKGGSTTKPKQLTDAEIFHPDLAKRDAAYNKMRQQ